MRRVLTTRIGVLFGPSTVTTVAVSGARDGAVIAGAVADAGTTPDAGGGGTAELPWYGGTAGCDRIGSGRVAGTGGTTGRRSGVHAGGGVGVDGDAGATGR